MIIKNRNIVDIDLSTKDETTIADAIKLLEIMEYYLFCGSDTAMDIDMGDPIERKDVDAARTVLERLLNDHCPSHWERI